MSSDTTNESSTSAEYLPTEIKASTSPQVKYDWYQTETQVVVNVLVKNVDEKKLKVEFLASDIHMKIVFNDGTEVEKSVHLFQDIIPDKCKFKVMSTKIEIRLYKTIGSHWTSLEKEEKLLPKKPQRNWDKFVSELEDDKMEGEAVLNALFQKIYNEGSDEVKKAMNKSFLESGGTELNTNWDAVSKGKVSIKPPEGMEWRTWDK